MKTKIIVFGLSAMLVVAQDTSAQDCSQFPNLAPYMPSCGGQPATSASPEDELKIVEVWTRAYMQCAINTVDRIDDEVSDAQTIAVALSAQCKDAYPVINKVMRVSDRDDLTKRLLPRLTEVVLYHRTAVKRKPSGIAPKKPQT